jgi:pimeloyl-ACP methyl ester carboxylesterase
MFRTALIAAAVLLTGCAPAETPAVGHRVEINGMQVYYEVSGTGEPLIVLHGAYMNIPSMGAIIPRLARTHRVYALEFQGHGRTRGWQPAFTVFIPQMTVEMVLDLPFAQDYRKLAANPDGFPALAAKLIALEKEPMAWEAEVKALKTPVLIISGDADVATLEHAVAMFRLLGGGIMGDMGQPLPASRLAVMPATSHTAVITQTDLLHAFIEPFLGGETPKGFFEE